MVIIDLVFGILFCHIYSCLIAKDYEDRIYLKWDECVNSNLDMFENSVTLQILRNKKIIANLPSTSRYYKDTFGIQVYQSYTYEIVLLDSNGNNAAEFRSSLVTVKKFDQEEFLDFIERNTFSYFWDEVPDKSTGLVKDKLSQNTCAISSTGFGLSALVIAAERKFKSYEELEERAYRILFTLTNKTIRKFGFLYHYLEPNGRPSTEGYEVMVSSIDSVLLFCGAIVAGEYFGGRVKELSDQLVSEANYLQFSDLREKVVIMGWQPNNVSDLSGNGSFISEKWNYYTDELILINVLGIGADIGERSIPPDWFYVWERNIGSYESFHKKNRNNVTSSFVYSLPGPLFTYQFAHLYIDFSKLGKDMPKKYGFQNVPSVNWFDNSVVATVTSRQYCMDRSEKYKGWNSHSWGPTACVVEDGYCVGGFLPNGMKKGVDCEGAVAPYGAISSMMLTPNISLDALNFYYNLRDGQGDRLVWEDVEEGGHGFFDTFNLDTMYVPKEILGIDSGPLLLAIENYRSGLIQKYFMKNEVVSKALKNIGFEDLY